ncbi:hypothetical protein APHAL10511_000863 [Amanita phalloides]|nr:hypothetical protein APHAL10511_000863 [Amanita phalloides]
MGPGRKLYHKPCLACTICSKRLDSRSLLEHDQLPYCQSCHIKNFGTKDLRHGNLPHKGDLSSSPTKATQAPFPLPLRVASPARPDPTAPLLKPTRSLATSPTGIRSPTFPRNNADAERSSEKDSESDSAASSSPSTSAPPRALTPSSTTTNSGRHGQGNLPRTIPLGPTRSAQPLPTADVNPSASSSSSSSSAARPVHNYSRSLETVPTASGLVPTATGTRYGALLNRSAATSFASVDLTGNNSNGSPRRWGMADTPSCPKCGKNVYFAEQVRAVGKIYHKRCLRCLECQTLLDSSRLRDHDGEPYCVRCYGKLHGPQGSGYALLGKAGG